MVRHCMKRHPRRRPTKSSSGFQAHPADHCGALVLVDGTAIRKKIKKDYEKALRDLDTSRQLLDRFHQADLPSFTRWLNSHFGALLTEIREVGQKLAADQELIFLIESEMMCGAGSYARAYKQVIEHLENPEPRQPQDDSGPSEEWDPFGAASDSDPTDGDEDPVNAFFDALFGDQSWDRGPKGKQGASAGNPVEAATPAPGVSRLKELYRELVRCLHPDTQREMTAQKTEWWHQVQAAYEAGDAEQLEVILTFCKIGESGPSADTSASLLQRITMQLKNSLRQVKHQLAELRRDPAWGFSVRTNHDVLTVQLRRALTADLKGMREHWQHTQHLLATWRSASERLRPPRRRKRAPRKPECPF